MNTNIINIFYNGYILNKNKLRESWLINNHPDMYESVINFTDVNNLNLDKFSIKLYHFINDIIEVPVCDFCRISNKRFIGFSDGYNDFCSKTCAIKKSSEGSIIKRRENTIKKWGVEHTSMLESVKCKQRETNMERWGTHSPTLNTEVLKKQKMSMLLRWGVEYSGQSEFLLEKSLKTRFDNYKNMIISNYPDLKIIDIPREGLLIINCDKCGNNYEVKNELLRLRYFRYKTECCLNCNPLKSYRYTGQNEILEFLKQYISESEITVGDRKVLNGKEIDILLPKLNIAIEFNGLYWHSELYKEKDYHLNKKKKCYEVGINLIHIWEDDWLYRKEITKSRILNLIGMNSERLFARKCKIKSVGNKECMNFMKENHLQGHINSSYKIGLYYNDELVSLMTFGKWRRSLGSSNSKSNEWELYRFCNKIGHNVIGSFTKLLKHFENEMVPKKVITYANRDWSSIDNVYELAGFNFDGFTEINYWYFKDSDLKKVHRFNFRKDKLIKMDKLNSKTEKESMRNLGWNIVYDCGNLKYSKNY